MLDPAYSIIRKCGGTVAVAKMTGAHVTRVLRWTYPKGRGGTGGLIPAKYHAPLRAAALAQGIEIAHHEFFQEAAAESGEAA